MTDSEVEWHNGTYYDTADLKYILDRLQRAMEGLTPAPGEPQRPQLVTPIAMVQIKYCRGPKYQVKLLHERVDGRLTKYGPSTDARRLVIALARRKELFGSELEALAGLTANDTQVPTEVLTELVRELLQIWQGGGVVAARLRQAYPKSGDPQWNWPSAAADLFLKTQVLPSCQLRIRDRAEEGVGLATKLLAARDAVNRLQGQLAHKAEIKAALEHELETAIRDLAAVEGRLERAKTKLRTLEAGRDVDESNAESEDEDMI